MSISKTVTSKGETAGQYLTGEEIDRLLGEIDLSDMELVRMDSYSDSDVYNKIKKTGAQKELLCSAVQTAIVGMGNKTYGSVSVNGNIVDIEKLYKKCDVKIKLELGAKLEPGDLTGRRLQRFFRKQISEYIKKTGIASYLWRKYSTHNEDFKHVVFPGAEHLVQSDNEVAYLLATYKTLDNKLNTKISERIERVLSARGIHVSYNQV
jgi:hypothetical protein